jgi:hypothetical protein
MWASSGPDLRQRVQGRLAKSGSAGRSLPGRRNLELGRFLWRGTPARGTGRCLLLGIGNKKGKKMALLRTKSRAPYIDGRYALFFAGDGDGVCCGVSQCLNDVEQYCLLIRPPFARIKVIRVCARLKFSKSKSCRVNPRFGLAQAVVASGPGCRLSWPSDRRRVSCMRELKFSKSKSCRVNPRFGLAQAVVASGPGCRLSWPSDRRRVSCMRELKFSKSKSCRVGRDSGWCSLPWHSGWVRGPVSCVGE